MRNLLFFYIYFKMYYVIMYKNNKLLHFALEINILGNHSDQSFDILIQCAFSFAFPVWLCFFFIFYYLNSTPC